jgi:hypothetical protein
MHSFHNFVTVMGSDYFQPVVVLCEALLRTKPDPLELNAMTSPRERGYAASICLLAVVCFESFMRRVRYLKKNNLSQRQRNEKSMLGLFRKLFPDHRLTCMLTEVYVLRDAIAHGHLWEVSYDLDDNWDQHVKQAIRDSIDDNKKFDAAVDLSTRQTRKLGLNVLPSRVNRTDVAKVLDIIFEALRFLQKEVDEDWQTDKRTVGFRGQRMELIKCVDTIKTDCFA